MKKIILMALGLMALSSTALLQARVCPQEGDQVSLYSGSDEALNFYKNSCYVRPNYDTGLFTSVYVIVSDPSNKVAARAPGINSITTYY
jgi:hypothetical protein